MQGAALGAVYSFVSGLYFRGKLTYARAFASPPPGAPASLVITPGRGLLPPETRVTAAELRDMACVPVDAGEVRYRAPVERDAQALAAQAGPQCEVVLLGSIATPKYLDPLLEVFGDRLLFPEAFVGRGDMSRGGLMLRCAQAGAELAYVPARSAVRHGPKPPRLERSRF
jgi:hypothetical protein